MATKTVKVGKLEFPVQDDSENGTASDYIQQAMDALKMQQGLGDPSNPANMDPFASDSPGTDQASGIQALLDQTGVDDSQPDEPAPGGGSYGGGNTQLSPGAASAGGNLGYGPEDQAAFQWIMQHESGGDPNAKNPTSTAFGRGQLLDYNRASYAQKLGISNPDTTDPGEQDRMMQLYIQERYGTPAKAKQFWEAHGWY